MPYPWRSLLSGSQLFLSAQQPCLTAGDPETYRTTCTPACICQVTRGNGGSQEKWLAWGSIMMTVRFSTELNLSLGPSVRSFPVKRFWALYNPLWLQGVKDTRRQVSAWPSVGTSALTAAFVTNQAWSSASEVAADFRVNYFSIFSFSQEIDGCTTLIYQQLNSIELKPFFLFCSFCMVVGFRT